MAYFDYQLLSDVYDGGKIMHGHSQNKLFFD
jgi:hypothetical protein